MPLNARELVLLGALSIALCALFASFSFIDEGKIGRLRSVNVIMLVGLLVMTAHEIRMHLRAKRLATTGKKEKNSP